MHSGQDATSVVPCGPPAQPRVVVPVPMSVQVLVRYPRAVMLVVFAAALLLSVLVAGFFNLSNPDGGLRIRDHVTSERADAWYDALQDYLDELAGNARQATQSRSTFKLDVYFQARGAGPNANVFSTANLERIRLVQERVVSGANYRHYCFMEPGTSVCAEPRSPLTALGSAATHQDIQARLREQIQDGSIPVVDKEFEYFVDRNFDVTAAELTSTATRITFSFGTPLKGYLNTKDRREAQEQLFDDFIVQYHEFLREEAPTDTLDVLFVGNGITIYEALQTMGKDLLLSFGAICFVAVAMWVHTRSLFLSVTGIIQVLLSFPLCFFVYRLLAQIKMFGALQVISVFIILGIGADDVFVLVDATKFAEREPRIRGLPFEQRFAWAFDRARKTMLTTSLTTAFAFAATAVSTIPAIRFFGIFTGLLVIVNFLLVCSFFAAAVATWYRYQCCPCCTRIGAMCCCKGADATAHQAGAGPTPPSGAIEEFFRDTVSPALIKWRKAILVFVGLFLIAACVTASHIKPASRTFSFFPDDHMFNRFDDLRDHVFTGSDNACVVKARLVWGIAGMNRDGTDPSDSDDVGKAAYDDSFDLTRPETQQFIADTCELILASEARLHVKPGEQDCFMLEFKEWREARLQPFPVPADEFNDELREFLYRPEYAADFVPTVGFDKDFKRVKFAYINVNTTADCSDPHENREALYDAWQGFVDERLAVAPEGTKSMYLTSYWYFVWMVTQRLFRDNTFGSMGLSVLLAFCILTVSTGNILVACLATVSIGGIVATIIAFMVVIGWELGTIEGVCITILVGFAVDYVVHMANAYTETQERDLMEPKAGDANTLTRVPPQVERERRVTHAFFTLGVSVLGGAVSTFGAAVFLLFATITFFNSFGIFFAVAIVISLLFAMVAFMASMAVVGPVAGCGDVPSCGRMRDVVCARLRGRPVPPPRPTATSGNYQSPPKAGLTPAPHPHLAGLTGTNGFAAANDTNGTNGSSSGPGLVAAPEHGVELTATRVATEAADAAPDPQPAPVAGGTATPAGDTTHQQGDGAPSAGDAGAGASGDAGTPATNAASPVADADPQPATATTNDADNSAADAGEDEAKSAVAPPELAEAATTVADPTTPVMAAAAPATDATAPAVDAIPTPAAGTAPEPVTGGVGPVTTGNVTTIADDDGSADAGSVGAASADDAAMLEPETVRPRSVSSSADPPALAALGLDTAALGATDRYKLSDLTPPEAARVNKCKIIMAVAFAVVVAVMVLVALLSDSGDDSVEAAPPTVDDSAYMPSLASLAVGEWTELRPGGDTMCSRGTPYAFFFRKGNPTAGHKVVVEFEGGGACWSSRTCGIAGGTFKETVEDTRDYFVRGVELMTQSGIRNSSNPHNPVQGWHHLYVPYCTGDVHWGDAIMQYEDDLVIRHKGARNAWASIKWLHEQLPAVDDVLVTGCSAGAYASIIWAPHIARLYPSSTRVVQHADSGVGVITDSFMQNAFGSWNATGFAFPYFATPFTRETLDVTKLKLSDLYNWVAAYDSGAVVTSQFTSMYDWNQAFFRLAMLNDDTPTREVSFTNEQAWSVEARRGIANLTDTLSFIASGDNHCVIPYRRFYRTQVGATSHTSWLTQLLQPASPPASTSCEVEASDTRVSCNVGVDRRPRT